MSKLEQNAYESPKSFATSARRPHFRFCKFIMVGLGGAVGVAMILPLAPIGRNTAPDAAVSVLATFYSIGFIAGSVSAWLIISLTSAMIHRNHD